MNKEFTRADIDKAYLSGLKDFTEILIEYLVTVKLDIQGNIDKIEE